MIGVRRRVGVLAGVEASRRRNVLVLAAESRPAETTSQTTGKPVRYGVTSLHVDHDVPGVQLGCVRSSVGSLHVLLLLELHEGVAHALLGRGPGAVRRAAGADVVVLRPVPTPHQLDVLDGSVGLELAQQLALRRLVGQSADEKRVVAVHAVELAGRLLLSFAVPLDRRREALGVAEDASAGPSYAGRGRRGADHAFRGRRALELHEQIGHARERRPPHRRALLLDDDRVDVAAV